MDNLIQANLELHAELGKEVRINLKNEAKINRLEKQQVRYEKDIQYLYRIIEKFEVQADYSKKEKDFLTLRNCRVSLEIVRRPVMKKRSSFYFRSFSYLN